MNVMEAITIRRSVRDYLPRPIPEASYQRLLTAMRYAPSACNLQPWRFVLVHDQDQRQKLAKASNGQMWMAQAPLIVVACGLTDQAYQKMAGRRKTSIDLDLAIALDHLSLAAVAEGLATCWIGAFGEQHVKDVLNVPDDVEIIALMPVGYPRTTDLNHTIDQEKRKKPQEIFTRDKYA